MATWRPCASRPDRRRRCRRRRVARSPYRASSCLARAPARTSHSYSNGGRIDEIRQAGQVTRISPRHRGLVHGVSPATSRRLGDVGMKTEKWFDDWPIASIGPIQCEAPAHAKRQALSRFDPLSEFIVSQLNGTNIPSSVSRVQSSTTYKHYGPEIRTDIYYIFDFPKIGTALIICFVF